MTVLSGGAVRRSAREVRPIGHRRTGELLAAAEHLLQVVGQLEVATVLATAERGRELARLRRLRLGAALVRPLGGVAGAALLALLRLLLGLPRAAGARTRHT